MQIESLKEYIPQYLDKFSEENNLESVKRIINTYGYSTTIDFHGATKSPLYNAINNNNNTEMGLK